MSGPTVIVFGPTGNVGSVAAVTAHKLGAKVVLAMRDTTKAIPGLSADSETAGRFERIQADLTQPDSLIAAVQKSGAKTAFIYLTHGSKDGMRGALEALKSAGIDFVVFVSSYTIPERAEDIPSQEIIPFVHAQVEINLEQIFGAAGFIGLKVGGLAPNSFRFKAGIKKGKVPIFYPDNKSDWVDTQDCGEVAGYYLAKGKEANEGTYVFVHGPELISQRDAAIAIGKAIGIKVEVESATAEQEWDTLVNKAGIPEPLAKYIITSRQRTGPNIEVASAEQVRKGNGTTERCTGHAASTLDQWIQRNKEAFSA